MFPTPLFADPQNTLRRVLLVKLSSLGDIVHALPLADALRAVLPDAHLAWAVREKFADLLENNPNLDAVHTLDGAKGARAAARFGRRLRREYFDAALDAQGLLFSGLVTRLSGAKMRVGLDRNREGNALFLTHAVVPGRQRAHIVEILRGFVPALGLPAPGAVKRQTYLAEGEAEQADALLAQAGGRHDAPVVGFIVGASTADKVWPRERWVALCRRVSDNGMRPVLVGGPSEAAIAEAIQTEAGGPSVVGSLVGKTPLRILASTLARCRVVVGGDSGPTHLAVAVGAPVVGLYGVTDPARTGPAWGPARSIVLDYAEAAAPTAARRARHSTLPDALARIPVNAVAGAVETLLRG